MATPSRLLFLLSLFMALQVGAPTETAAQNRVRPAHTKQAKAKVRNTRAVKAAVRQVPDVALRAPGNASPSIKAQTSLKAALKASGSTFFTRDINGAQRIIANVTGQEALDTVSRAMGKASNTIQLLHVDNNSVQHTMVIFDGELVHTQYAGGTGNWRITNWGNSMRTSDSRLFSAIIALSSKEATTLRNHIKQGRKDQGPDHLAGPGWANGKLKNTSLGGCRSFNCTSTWSAMPLGANGETLAQISGISNRYLGNPRQLQKELETGGNDRIIAVAVYGPRVENFGANPAQIIVDL